MIILVLLLPLLLISGLWIYGFVQPNDFSVPTKFSIPVAGKEKLFRDGSI